MFPTNSERLIGISDAFSAFVYGYPSSCPRAHCTPNKRVPTLRYTRRHGPVYTGGFPWISSGFPWISEDRLLNKFVIQKIKDIFLCSSILCWCSSGNFSFSVIKLKTGLTRTPTGLIYIMKTRPALTPSLPWCHFKTTNKRAKCETLKLFFFFLLLLFGPGFGKDFHQNASHWKEMCYRTGKCIVFEASLCIFQPGNFTGWGSEGVNH